VFICNKNLFVLIFIIVKLTISNRDIIDSKKLSELYKNAKYQFCKKNIQSVTKLLKLSINFNKVYYASSHIVLFYSHIANHEFYRKYLFTFAFRLD